MKYLPVAVIVLFCGKLVFATPTVNIPKDCLEYQTLKVLNWNVMAPMWVDYRTFNAFFIDRRLLNGTRRLNTIINTLKSSDADVILLQEVQLDWFAAIQSALRLTYEGIYGRHIGQYWRTHLPRHRIYRVNGAAIFYRTSKLSRGIMRRVETTDTGNVVLIAVLVPTNQEAKRRSIVPIMVVNGELERGLLGSNVRKIQVGLIQKAIAEMKNYLLRRRQLLPQVIWSGDFNTLPNFPEYNRVVEFSYENVFDVLGRPNPSNYFQTFYAPHATSYTFVENFGIASGKIKVLQSYFDEAVENRPKDVILEDLKGAVSYVFGLLEERTGLNETQVVERYSSLLLSLKYDFTLNHALRRGSDHTYQSTWFCLYPFTA